MTLALSAVVLPDRHPVSAFLDDVRAVEAAGVGTVWTYDHLSWPTLRDGPWYGSVPLLAAAAAVTTTVRLGLQVASPNFRHPVPFAKELMTLDQLCGGRLEVGVGAGTEGPDATVLGDEPISRRERFERFAEWLGLLDQLLREAETTVRGPRYRAVDARQLPGCVQQPRVPFTVAGAGPKALGAVAAYGQAWVTFGPYGVEVDADGWFAALGEQSERLTAALAAAGRPADDVHRIALLDLDAHWPFESRARYAGTVAQLDDLGFDEISVHWPRRDGRGMPTGALDFVLAVHG
ncbi:LLM class flavin-dependent oxidoreductase [Nakamurella leprariae]|uniref:LLM class flavin-dependent oxidoreductase n=1 Tax=Nakamurella leprariae TaxID=2803911 RepID=A0A938YJE8_9ACTN|nr:LLM class flavin-dependent oxidoreductase [Nakamurella leprariae]MBM9468890.1 LLM class flavin-dependent oxidoreductase [Nakamurella leprariae]